MASEDIAQQLQLVQQELNQVQDQITSLLEHQEKLLEQRQELRALLESCRKQEGTGSEAFVSSSTKEDWTGSFEWDKRAADLRLNVFGISTYRTNQREIINAVMSGRNVMVIMAAGGGKSLCYQLPALLRSGIALIVSPLLSLIQDQVMGLKALGIPAGMLTSTTTKEEEKAIYLSLEKGTGGLRILYVTPEKIAKSKRFMSKLEKCNKAGRLSLMAIDEAHCCSQWGHDFRPDYKNLGILKKQFPKVPIIALTATATERVQTDVREMLQIPYSERFTSSVNRPNLFYEVREKKSNASAAIDDIADFIRGGYTEKQSGIVYCFTRKECEQVAEELRQRGISASHYHADMAPDVRANIHTRWSGNKIQVIVGTVAFGMGINKPDVRFVIHHSLSKSLETYYQESGRAGRDGLPSHCVLFFRPADIPRQSSMVFSEVAGLHNLYAIARFCQSKRSCRREAFFRHFGEPVQDCNGMCDNCAYAKEITELDVTAHAKSIVTLLKDSDNQKTTMLQLVDSWRSRSRQTEARGEAALVKELSKEDVERVIIQLVLDGILKEEFAHTAYATNAYVTVSAGSRFLLQGKRKIILEVAQGLKSKKGTVGIANEDSKLQSGMAHMLDALRQQIAGCHGSIFPHSVLSSQHIKMLCSRRPDTLNLVEEVVGKRKVEQYGQQILDAIRAYVKEHPDEEFEEEEVPWVAPKGSKTSIASQSAQKSASAKRKSIQRGVSQECEPQRSAKKSCAAGKAETLKRETSALSKSPGVAQDAYIDLDSDSDDDVELREHSVRGDIKGKPVPEINEVEDDEDIDGPKKKRLGIEECTQEGEDLPSVKTNPPKEQRAKTVTQNKRPASDDEDEDFVLVKRTRRKK
ncbi:ATP-dependent DNA helicase Q1 [Marchantia polymorpha subsp. ruderalis]|uniref:ATP-dependent DNA helicase n=2 Tax=Marchantia polymorpha TaxID=3197 RepID=A0AAF6B4W6_MARPO|nr:hypothetical protein MARPO_0066s0087 [Marchantia polymorpha]BBN07050.1 hypothetical protein Mp_4g00540 [Marchantia polymorpha subsp. ruderalis]|eukprot:PTQ36134.1 hypothetical protein MARPO_0066s0087 [Marchantia polymorpha]